MKTPTGSIAAKVIAVFCFFLSLILLAVSGLGVLVLAKNDAYFDDGRSMRNTVIDYAADDYHGQLYRFANQIMWGLQEFDHAMFVDIYGEKNCNYFFTLIDSKTGEVVLSNYTADEVLRDYGTVSFHNYNGIETPIGDTDGDGFEDYYIEEYSYDLLLISGVRSNLIAKDRIYYFSKYTDLLIDNRYLLIVGIAFFGITAVALLVFLICAAGHHHGEQTPRPNTVDRIPFDIYLAGIFAIVYAAAALPSRMFYNDIATVAFFIFLVPVTLAVLLTTATRIKTKTLLKNTLIYHIIRLIIKGIILFWKTGLKLPLYWKTALIWVSLSIVECFVILSTANEEYLLLFWLTEKVLVTPFLIWVVLNLQSLRQAGKELASGNIEHTVDTRGMMPAFKEHAEHLNGIGEGLQVAVDKNTRNERMRAELITNVSHDIKTPLTSLINYADLLQKEGLQSEHAQEYLSVLERQSKRLKKLTEDLIEASKASTGAIKVTFTPLDVNILLQQATAEYQDRLESNALYLISDLQARPAVISADGRLLWRVFDNLLSNIVKYSKTDTRVYLTTRIDKNTVTVVFKNISAEPLNISEDELTERFVRGDRSRNTEGSGLGLSIAKSLTELQGGTFNIEIDGDLFKSTITFERS